MTGAERDGLIQLTPEARQPGWWHLFRDVLPNPYEVYIGLEAGASSIRNFEPVVVPGLLQTEDYARAVTLLGHGNAPAEEVERRVSLRMARKPLLKGPQAPHLWAVIDEAVLRRPIGGPKVMRAQLEYLIECAAMPSVTLQVIPFQAGGHSAAGGPFSILRFAEADLPDIVYLEQLTSAIYLDKRETVDHYMAVMERLCLDAFPAEHSTDAISTIAEQLS